MKIKKTIINTSKRLMGFWVTGKQSEFGGYSPNIDEYRPIQLEEFTRVNFKNNQIAVEEGRVHELGNFRINELPMVRFDGQQFRDVDSTITLTKRIISDGQLIGFKVAIIDEEINYKYEDVIRLAGWFKPGNFVVRTTKTKIHIAGKPGVLQLENLPEEILGSEVDTPKRRRVGTGGGTLENIENIGLHNDKDLMTLYSIVDEYGGVIIKLPEDKYKVIETPTSKIAGEFRSLGIGEIADPHVKFGEKRLNADTTFKKVGQVMVPVTGAMPFPVYSYTWSSKVIFLNGESHMGRFAIAVQKDGVEKIVKEYQRDLVIKPIVDKSFTDPISQLTGKKDLFFYEVDASKLSIIVPKEAHRYIISNKEIRVLEEKLIRDKIQNKYCNSAIKEMNEVAKQSGKWLVKEGAKPYGLYGGLSPQYLKALHECGINIFSGAYIKTVESDDDEIRDVAIIEIEYGIKGLDVNKLTYEMMCSPNIKQSKNPIVDEKLIGLIEHILSIQDMNERFNYALKYQRKIEKEMYWIKRKLWLHKLGMYYVGDGKIHTHDRTVWYERATRSNRSTVYDCIEYDCDGLYLTLTGMVL